MKPLMKGLVAGMMWRHLYRVYGDRVIRNDEAQLDAVAALAYGLNRAGNRLTQMSLAATEISIKWYFKNKARYLIWSHAYPGLAEIEKTLKYYLVGYEEFEHLNIKHIMMEKPSANTYLEADKLIDLVYQMDVVLLPGFRTIGVVGERLHFAQVSTCPFRPGCSFTRTAYFV